MANPESAEVLPFGQLQGIAPLSVPAFSNGNENHFSLTAAKSACLPHVSIGPAWSSLEFVRRFILVSKGCWVPHVAMAESIWDLHAVVHSVTKQDVPLHRFPNGGGNAPQVGDILVWRRAHDMPLGHCAIVAAVGDTSIAVAEQNMDPATKWSGQHSRELSMAVKGPTGSGSLQGQRYEVFDDDPLLGWMRVDMVDVDQHRIDWMDDYRPLLGRGHLQRIKISDERRAQDASLPWLVPTENCDFFVHRSLVNEETQLSAPQDYPSGYYTLDYDLWMRIKKGAKEVHQVAIKACHHVLYHKNSATILENEFGIPPALHDLLRTTFATSPCLGGRFDFGFDGKNLKIFEYNSDSSGALLEAAETQGKWFDNHDITEGVHTGQYMFTRMVAAWTRFKNRGTYVPEHFRHTKPSPAPKLVHFLVDDDDEEKYTALYMMRAAATAGFKVKMIIGMKDLFYNPKGQIVDSNGSPVTCIWKTWSWDTALRDYNKKHNLDGEEDDVPQESAAPVPDPQGLSEVTSPHSQRHEDPSVSGSTTPADRNSRDMTDRSSRDFTEAVNNHSRTGSIAPTPGKDQPVSLPKAKHPRLCDVLLREDMCVIEPFWKMVVGNKALLPYMSRLAPDQDNLLFASFELTDKLRRSGYVSKPVSGRAGQNISLHPPEQVGATPITPHAINSVASESGGRFADAIVVYQERLKLLEFDGFYPILCAWMIDDDFAGVVIREDTSKITKLGSLVAPARLMRY